MPSRISRITDPALADILGLLDVVGEHAYVALAFPDGRLEELFQGPGADRLLGGAEPDPEMENWDNAIHHDDRPAYEAFNRRLSAGEAADVEYRLLGADGITRWVHDRAAPRRREDGSVEISGIVSDVTERRRLRAELYAAHAALSRVVAAMGDHLYTVRVAPSGRVVPVYDGPHREALAGGVLPEGEAGDRLWLSLLHPDDRAVRRAALKRLAHGEPLEVEYRLIGLDGRVRVVHDRLRPRREPDGLYYDGVARDITERRELEAQLRRSADTDALTGAANRRCFAEVVEARLARAAGVCGLLLIDADHFKQINDEHGHRVGDAVLIELVRRLQAAAGPGEALARWGGEEFALFLEGVESDAQLERRAQALRAAVAAAPVVTDGVTVRVTVSIGAVRADARTATLDALVEAADRCLYAAKHAGRDRVSLTVGAGTAAGEPAAVELARALAFAAAARHATPEAHAAQVALLATLTAERMGLPADAVLRCRVGGWLHDVGKLAIPERVLERPDALDAGDWTLMRTHPAIGEGIVRRFGTLRTAAPAIRHHHERYDGDGYPDGLVGDAIPVEARIVAAADAYAAMTAERPYARARTPHEAADELRRCAGSQLDPAVVAALLDVLGPVTHTARRPDLATPHRTGRARPSMS